MCKTAALRDQAIIAVHLLNYKGAQGFSATMFSIFLLFLHEIHKWGQTPLVRFNFRNLSPFYFTYSCYNVLVYLCRIASPFTYTFAPVPVSDDGAIFLDMPNLQFSVNKDSANLDMANEFMRFLITSQELNKMAQNKGLMSPTKDLSFNSMYAAFGDVPESRILSPEVIGLTDDAVKQVRQANYGVCTGVMTIDEAIAGYGTFTD